MDKFQLLICDVALAGDIRNVVHRGVDNPVTFPERCVLEFLHGEGAITNVRDMGEVQRHQGDERKRLNAIYGSGIIDQLFPGVATSLPLRDTRIVSFDSSPRGVEKTPKGKAAGKRVAKARAEATNLSDDADPFAGTGSPDTDEDDTPPAGGGVDPSIDARV